ncbi:NAD-dependent epimerase/dehydratase family protein [Kutzneria kofuensis]|uniref:Nucleoside-diphosphate-sugar epimerase n=1 Tax=Kutzneria kofuensis TaxID=103725 RepID=A0A7W9KMA9_9PSEU|nr:NAD(P)-dependent oxidoreductase [Kutzneria kofuensis]MBB5895186.1 nucleoside-diphosphate-sugar epimerase [Kutzneria kofuensis]
MRVLVTGAGGMLGAEIVAVLSVAHEVLAHDRNVGDLRDRAQVEALLDGVDAVVHAAALPSPLSAAEPVVFGNNVDASFHLLDAAGRAGIKRIVYVSSLSALGLAWSSRPVSPLFAPVTERHPYVGDDVYGLSKLVGELIGETVSRRWGTEVVSLRFPFIGSGDRLRRHLDHVRRDPGADRAALWSWIDTRDAARAVVAALTARVEGYALVNVAAPDTTSSIPTGELMRRFHPSTRMDGPLDGFAVPFSLELSRELLGFTAVHTWRPTIGGT